MIVPRSAARLLLAAALLTLTSLAVAEAESDEQQPRDDALFLAGVALAAPGFAAVCHVDVEANQDILKAADIWKQRNTPEIAKVLSAIRRTGGMTASEKRKIDRAALRQIRSIIHGSEDPNSVCTDLVGYLESPASDIVGHPERAAAMERLERFLAEDR